MSGDNFTAAAIATHLTTRFVGRTHYQYEQVASTNDLARQLTADGSVVLAEEQTAGRGRLGRRWLAPPGSSLHASFLLRPHRLLLAQAYVLTMAMAVAVYQATRATLPAAEVALKWPNDLLVNGKKAGGILAELETSAGTVSRAIIGLGLNVNFDPATIPDLPPTATSLSVAAGREVDRLPLFIKLCAEFERRYLTLQQDGYATIRDEWDSLLAWQGAAVRVSDAMGLPVSNGTFVGTDSDGALRLQLADGSVQRIVAGDLSLRLE